jgi:hypothetical protein
MKRREIVVTEDPRLHLVWIYDRVFIKPLPKYLLSHDFWQIYLLSRGGYLPKITTFSLVNVVLYRKFTAGKRLQGSR